MNNLEGTEYHWMYNCYIKYKELMYKYKTLNLEKDLDALEIELIKLSNDLKNNLIK